jgi:hypothetical protein
MQNHVYKKLSIFSSIAVAIASLAIPTSAKADTVDAHFYGHSQGNWDPTPYNQESTQPALIIMAQSPTPVTYMTPLSANAIRTQITEGEFRFRGILRRTTGKMFVGEDSQVRVMYDKGTSHVVVINKVTGTEFYNYVFSTANEGYL